MKKQFLTKEQVNKKYKDKYVEFTIDYDYSKQCWIYVIWRVHNKIHENTTLGQDVGTWLEYRR